MKIRTQFIINLVVLGIILLLVSVAVMITNRWAEDTHQQEGFAAQLEREAYELGYLANDYLLYHESQQAVRWESKFASFSDHLSNMQVNTPEQNALLADIKTNQQRLKTVFMEIKASIENAPQIEEAGFDEKFMRISWNRLEVQSQGMIFNASRLERMLSEQEDRLTRQIGLFNLVLISGLGAFLVGIYWSTFRRTLQAITTLQDGTRIIGSGDLDFAIAVKNEDEIGELSHAFNQMTGQLKTITASRVELEREITERKRAEEALRETNKRLREQAEELQMQAEELKVQAEELREQTEKLKIKTYELEAVNELLRESQQRLNRAQEIAHLGSWELDLVNNQLTWSDEVYRIFGLQPQEFGATYKAFLEAVHPEDRAAVDAAYSGSIQAGRDSYEIEHRVVKYSSGEIRLVHEKCEHFRNQSGQIIRSVGMVHDITEREHAEQALLESEERYRFLFENMLSGYAHCQMLFEDDKPRDFIYLDVNDAFEKETGLKDVTGKRVSEVIPDIQESNPELFEIYGRVALSGKPEMFETHVVSLGIWFSISVYSPKPGYFVAVFENITERKRVERALLESEEKYRLLADNSNDWIYWIRPDGNFRYVSPSCECVTGFAPLEFMNNPRLFTDIIHPEDQARVEAHLGEIRGEGESHNLEYRIITKTDEIRWISHSCAPVFAGDSEYMGRTGTNRDITERKRAEAEITSLSRFPTENPNPILRVETDGRITYANAVSQELLELWHCKVDDYLPEQLKDLITAALDNDLNKTVDVPCNDKVYSIMFVPIVESRYVNIYGRDITERKRAEEELQMAMEELKHSNAELEQFAYVASHDLQEPLRMVSSYVQLLAKRYRGQLDSDADEFIAFAVDGATRMQNLINDLLSYSRVGRRGNPFTEVSCTDTLEETLTNLQVAIEESGAIITYESLPVLKADRTQLVMVFQNLLSNAIKFHGSEPPSIHVGARCEQEEWIFSVGDNGIGLDPKFAERIFVIFQRLHDRSSYPGTGIGLAICKRIIQRHGGRIWVESQPGKGSTFYFTLPVREMD